MLSRPRLLLHDNGKRAEAVRPRLFHLTGASARKTEGIGQKEFRAVASLFLPFASLETNVYARLFLAHPYPIRAELWGVDR
jgi:hypothetical protein